MSEDRGRPDNTERHPADTPSEPHHIADEPVGDIAPNPPEKQSPVTPTGLPVEEQIEKEWDPNKDGGLPTFLRHPDAGSRR